ncbi:extracellular solute-binding protein [Leisingera daeponensis]|uniref:extracellular solute-binding protein n=1 Tax=Leisingera daeponensis TaxID=405746 RepID=UPI001C976B49|nr:extracellular solute-binding protein [Leisingera daeponensis]MBY6059111.1 extracellular solute-binding protein [Leisingera daeponensis]
MRMTIELAACLFTTAAISLPAVADSEGEVWLYNWSGYIDPAVIEKFQAATGRELLLDVYEESDEAEARLTAQGTGYDLAVVPSEIVGRLISAGAVRRFDLDSPGVDRQLLDILLTAKPQAEGYALPYLWGTTGLVYDLDAVIERLPDAPLDSWALLFDPENAKELADCGITVIDSVEEMVPAALSYLGLDPHSRSPEKLDAAFDVLAAIAPYVRSFDTAQYDDVLGGNICLAAAWSTDGLAAFLEKDSTQYRYIVPKEGTNLWADLFVVPSDARNMVASMQLLDFILQPEMIASSAAYANAFANLPSSRSGLDKPDFSVFPPALSESVRETLYFVKPLNGEEKRLLDRRWRMIQIGL